MTLDAGGTNFVFSAVQGRKEIVSPLRLDAHADNLNKCLSNIILGFEKIKNQLTTEPVAISFAFPGPADYPNGIIDDLPNFPSIRGGVALGPMLLEKFKIPVFINNDGNLFTLGEAAAGLLPWVNQKLEKAGSLKRFKNLFGITLGTGFGAGIVINNELLIGDNSNAGEIWITRNVKHPRCFAEEGVSIRAVRRVYEENGGTKSVELSPKNIYDIAKGNTAGNQQAATKAFEEMGEVIADSLANATTLIDGLIVIGGGLAGASEFIVPAIVKKMNGTIETFGGEKIPRLVTRVYNLDEKNDLEKFLKGKKREISIPFTHDKFAYDPEQRTGIGLARLDTNMAVSIGAWMFALKELEKG
ncbi:MAG: ROK family protein [Bacteroidales bacterium]|nr:ROK family protein [Bacteroidales bacterium]